MEAKNHCYAACLEALKEKREEENSFMKCFDRKIYLVLRH